MTRTRRPRSRCRSLLIWAQALLLCLFVQSAFGCMGAHASLCADDAGGTSGLLASDASHLDDGDCTTLCAHCHGGCAHCALASQRSSCASLSPAGRPPLHVPQCATDAAQHPLLRPPAQPV